MKQAYVSVVTVVPNGTDPDDYFKQVERVDQMMVELARLHETVIVALNPTRTFLQRWRSWATATTVNGPVSLVISHNQGASHEEAMLSGLGRCVGDFVLEWEGALQDLTADECAAMFAVSDTGKDIVLTTPKGAPASSRTFYWMVNRYRTAGSPMASSVGALYSRAAVDTIVDTRHSVRHRKVRIAQSGIPTGRAPSSVARHPRGNPLTRLDEALDVLIGGTRLGTRMTYWLASLAALGGLAAAVYAIVAAMWKGYAPEGWVTLMIVVGLGFAAILIILALLGEMLSRIMKFIQGDNPTGITIETRAPIGTLESDTELLEVAPITRPYP